MTLLGCFPRAEIAAILALTWTLGCCTSRQIRDPEYCELVADVSFATASADPIAAAMNPVAEELAGPHPVEEYIRFGLAQNPTVQAARLRVESLAHRVPQAASLEDPMLDGMYETGSLEREVSVMARQQLPWFGKLNKRAELAEEDVNVARAELAAAELTVVERIQRAYYDLYSAEQAIAIAEQERVQLKRIENLVDQMYRVQRQVSQQDVLRAQVEALRLESEVVQLRQELASAQARLTRQLHLSPDTAVRTISPLPQEDVPRDFDSLFRRAIASRPELHAQLAAVARERVAADLARLDYFSDATLGMGWAAKDGDMMDPGNGRDTLLVTLAVNLPVYRKRLEAGVREAETQAVAQARQYDALKDQTGEEVKDLFAQASSQAELLRLMRDEIIPKARLTLEQSQLAYTVREVDFLQLIDNWRQLLRFQISEKQLEAQLRQTLASLARVVGTYEIGVAMEPPAPEAAQPPLPQTSPSDMP